MSEPSGRTASFLARWAVVHAGLLMVFLSWHHGGMEPRGRLMAAWLLVPTPVVTILLCAGLSAELKRRARWILVPLLLLTAQVLAGALNPSMQVRSYFGADIWFPIPHRPWLPSGFLGWGALPDYAFFAGLFLLALNVTLARPRRFWLHGLLITLLVNAGVLAVVGTLFKLLRAEAILGITPSPNPNFFASFIYPNHWVAFALLGMGAAAGMAMREERLRQGPWSQSPAPAYWLVVVILGLTLPLSGSRSGMLLGAALTLAVLVVPSYRRWRSGRGGTLTVILAALVLGVLAAGILGQEAVKNKSLVTRQQWQELRDGGIGEARFTIYRDTLRLIREKPVFGWGWDSFRYAYQRVQTPLPPMETKHRRVFVREAHNDWLEIVAELGLVGLALGLMMVGAWLRWARGAGGWRHAPGREAGMALVALAMLAVFDFPAANPAVVITALVLLAVVVELARNRSISS